MTTSDNVVSNIQSEDECRSPRTSGTKKETSFVYQDKRGFCVLLKKSEFCGIISSINKNLSIVIDRLTIV